MGKLDGRVAMVTGAARGIGAAVAERLAEEGVRVAVLDLDEQACFSVVNRIREAGGNALGLGCNVVDKAQVESAVDRIVSTFGQIDILVNNAGVIRDNLLFKMSDDDWDTVMAVHLRGHFLCSRAVQKYMTQQNFGKIVNVSSTSALGNRGQANYAAAKAGIQGFTKTLAIELGPFNINVNAVAPGFIDTDMTRQTAERMGLNPDDFKTYIAKETPLRRVGQPRDVANVIAFLCSEESSFVSGQIIYVAGGPRA